MFLTLAQTKASRQMKAIAQTCSSDDDFRDLVNEGTRRLLKRGDWKGTTVPLYVCARNGCVTFPRMVESVRAFNFGNARLTTVNEWYQFIPKTTYDGCCGRPCTLVGPVYSPVTQEIYNVAQRELRVYLQYAADAGQTITIFGVDWNNNPLQTVTGTTVTEGMSLTMQFPFASFPTFIKRIDRVLKTVTQGYVRMLAYDATTGYLEGVALYEPSETNPQYAQYRLNAGCCGTPSADSATPEDIRDGTRSCVALVKLAFIPAQVDNDLVLINDIDALKMMVQAIRAEDSGDLEKSNALTLMAVKELNMESRNENRDYQTAVSVNAVGSCIGSLM